MSESLPELPFDGQIFIDAFRVKWEYNSELRCWQRRGVVSELPAATELQLGLLSARLKQLLDGIPEKGGHFGIIAKPLLSLKSNGTPFFKDEISKVYKDESGTVIIGLSSAERPYDSERFNGKLLRFTTGLLINRSYLIFTNDTTKIYIDGDATSASQNDKFAIFNKEDYNPNGVILGDIVLVSESIDITCVDGQGSELSETCNNLSVIRADDPDNPPALDFKINDNFINNLCVTIPGCIGPTGSKGDQGDQGDPGTGDGPTGDQGDQGDDAPSIANTFTGIKIVDVDDIYDTAVVALELDTANGRLGVIKARVRSPNDFSPADKIMSTPVSRSVDFTDDDSFSYEVVMPSVDPIGVADVDLLKYPHKFKPNSSDETIVSKIKLSSFLNKLSEFYNDKLLEVNDKYNQEIKTYINGKDEIARGILADMAQEVATCEFELPIEFCLGISPNDCGGGEAEGEFNKTEFDYPLAGNFFSMTSGVIKKATDLGTYTVVPTTSDSIVDQYTSIKYPDSNSPSASVTLPAGGYIIQWLSGTIKSSATDYLVGSDIPGEGLEILYIDGGATEPEITVPMPIPSETFNPKEQSAVEFAYREAPINEKAIGIEIVNQDGGQIRLKANLPGIQPQGSIKVKVLRVILT